MKWNKKIWIPAVILAGAVLVTGLSVWFLHTRPSPSADQDNNRSPLPLEDSYAPPETEKNEIEKTEPEIPEEPAFPNPLTGLPGDKDLSSLRPLAVMINNIDLAIPQHGIGQADILYECIVEGGITRLMAVYSDYSQLPYTGSVRSSRDYYIDLAEAHDAIYAHCGGSPDAYAAISSRRIDNIDGVNGSKAASDAYWKDADRVRNMGYEHASMTNGEKMTGAIQNLGIRTALSEGFTQPLAFSAETDMPEDATTACSLNVKYSFYAQSFFSYDEKTGLYKKGQYGAPHIDANTDETLTFQNVLILGGSYSNIAGDEKNRLDLNFTGTGKGYYLSDGKLKDIVWKKQDRRSPYTLYEADGETPLLLKPGKSYIGIANGLSCVSVYDTPDERLQ